MVQIDLTGRGRPLYSVSNCTQSTCQLDVGEISSTHGGATWGAATMVAGPMTVTWLASTTQGFMVGDYISTSFDATGVAHGVFAVATAPSGGVFDEAMFTQASGFSATAASLAGEVAAAEHIPAGINQANGHAAHRWH
jgi:hypothetical protein